MRHLTVFDESSIDSYSRCSKLHGIVLRYSIMSWRTIPTEAHSVAGDPKGADELNPCPGYIAGSYTALTDAPIYYGTPGANTLRNPCAAEQTAREDLAV